MDLIDYADEIGISKEEASKIINTTGISQICISDDNQTSSDLCIDAFNTILEDHPEIPNEIEAVIFVSQTPDFIAPQTSNIIQHKLEMSNDVLTFDLRMGCSGYVYGLMQAKLLINSGLNKVLLLAGDTSTKFINKKDKTVSMVFGDAGSATVIEKKNNSKSFFCLGSDGSNFDKLIIKDGAFRNMIDLDKSFEEIQISDGIIRSNSDLYMDGMAIMNFAIERVPKSIDDLINYSGISKNSINKVILHQANAFMIKYLAKKIKIDQIKVPFEAAYFGNTGPSSIPLALCNLNKKGKLKGDNLDNYILSGFGIGLSWATSLLSLKHTKFYNY